MDTLSAQKGGAAGADITLGYLYMKSGTGFPHISFSLMLSSVIISVALFLRPSLYTSLGTNLLMTHWWQLITGRFAHGPQPPVLVHLATNLMVFGLFGVLTERAIRAERLLLLALTAISMELLMRYWMDSWGNGISAVAWAVTPFGLMMAIEGLRRWKSSSGGDPVALFAIFVLLLAWVVMPMFVGIKHSWLDTANILYTISVIIGFVFLIAWKDHITRLFEGRPEGSQEGWASKMVHVGACVIGYGLVVFNAAVVAYVVVNNIL